MFPASNLIPSLGDIWGWRYSVIIINLGIWWRRVVTFTLLLLYPAGNVGATQWIGNWVGPGADLEAVENNLSPCKESNPNSSATQPVAYRYTD
jgi:hypothetical protein